MVVLEDQNVVDDPLQLQESNTIWCGDAGKEGRGERRERGERTRKQDSSIIYSTVPPKTLGLRDMHTSKGQQNQSNERNNVPFDGRVALDVRISTHLKKVLSALSIYDIPSLAVACFFTIIINYN